MHRLSRESLVRVEGELVAAPTPISGCSQKHVELRIRKIFVVSNAIPQLPFQIDDASCPESEFEKEVCVLCVCVVCVFVMYGGAWCCSPFGRLTQSCLFVGAIARKW